MASIDRDYVLGIAVQLQTESIAEFEAQVKRQLEAIKPVKVKVLSLTPEENAQLQKMLGDQQAIIDSADAKRKASTESMLANWKKRTVGLKAQSEEETAIIERMQREQQTILDANRQKQASDNQAILDGWKSRTAGVQAQLEAENAIIARLTSEQNAILAENAARNATSISDMRKGFAANTIGMTDPGAWEADMREKIATAKMLKQEMKDLGGPANFAQNYDIGTEELKEHLNFVEQYAGKVQQLPSYWDHTFSSFKNHLGQWTLMTASITAAYAALEQFQHAYQELSEFQVQGVLFQANQRSAALQGIPTDGTTTQELLSSSIQLATKWGDKVNDVAQDLSLWYKRTGDLNAAMYLTNQALEFQLTTGTDLEDVYKTLTGLSVQAQGQKLGGIFGSETFDLSKTKDVLHEIFAAAVAAGGGMRQLSSSEKELGGNSNGAALLLDAIDKDNAALKMLGSTMTDSIALNAALIQSFGNTGSSASEAGEKIGRIAGSLASLSVPGALDKFKKAGMDVTELSKALDNHQNVLFAVLDLYGKMDAEYGKNGEQFQMMMSHILGGTRQFEAVQAIYEAYKENLKQIKSAMSDLEQEDQTANQMHDTLRNTVDRLNSEWEAFAMVIGGPVMGALTSLVQGTADSIGGLVKLYGVIGAFGDLALGSNPLTVERDKAIIANPFGYENGPQMAVPKGKLDSQGRFVFRGGYVDKNGIVYSGTPQEGPAMFAPGHNPFEMTRIGDINAPGTQQWLKHYSHSAYQNIPAYDVSLALAGQPIPAMDTFMQSVHGMSKLAKYNYDFNKINDLMRKGESQGNFSGGAGNGASGSVPDYSQAAQVNRDLTASYQNQLSIKQSLIYQDQEQVRHIQSLIQVQGNSKALTDQLTAAYQQERQAIQGKDAALASEMNSYLTRANQERDKALSYPQNSKERKGWMALSDEDLSKAASLRTELQRNHDTWLELADAISKADRSLTQFNAQRGLTAADKSWAGDLADFKSGKINLDALRGDENSIDASLNAIIKSVNGKGPEAEQAIAKMKEITAAIKQPADQINQFVSRSNSETSNGIWQNQMDMTTISDSDKRYYSAIREAQQRFDSFKTEYDKYYSEAGAAERQELDAQLQLQQAWMASSDAVAQYERRLSEIKSSPTYAAITALGNDLGNTLTSDVMGAFTASDNNQANAIQSQITALQNEKNLLQGKNSEVERMMLEQRISQLEKDKAGIEDRMRHPGFLKGIEEDMAKAVMKGLTDRLTKDLQDAFVNSILGKNPADSPQVVATNTNTTALNSLTNAILTTNGMGSGLSASSINIPGIGNLPTWAGISGGSAAASLGGMASGLDLSSPISSSTTLPSGSFNFGGPGGSVPSGIPGSGGGMSGVGIGAGTAALAGLTSFPFFGSSNGTPNVSPGAVGATASGSGGTNAPFWSSGTKNTQHIMGAIGGLSAAVQGYDQGGFTGSLESGIGMFEALTSLGVPAPIALPVAAVDFLFSLFHPHYNASQNPDMFGDSGYAQGLANAQGISQTQANGTVYEDPGLKQQLGGMTELQYLDAWYNSYPGGKGLNPQGKQLWDEIGRITGNGKGLEVRGLHQGNVYVSLPGQDSQVGEGGNWQTVLQDIGSATQQLYALENQDMAGKGTWISVNSYGAGGGGSSDFSPWYSPGLNSSDISSVLAMPYPPLNSNGSVTTSPGDPSGGTYGGSRPNMGGGGGGVSPMNMKKTVFMNTDVIAQQVNSWNIQRQTSGWAMNY